MDRPAVLEAQFDTAGSRLKASIVDPITLNADDHDKVWSQIRRWRRELSVVTGQPSNGSQRMMVV